jgi:hypothetical protein
MVLWPALADLPPVEFKVPPSFPAGASPAHMVVADVNEDGLGDLITANFAGSSVSVLLGAGRGAFAPAVAHATGAGPSCVAAADFNGDRHLDLVTANAEGWSGPGSLSVLLGLGDGSFTGLSPVVVGQGSSSVAVDDFDRDGKRDVIVAISGGWSFGNQVTVLRGRGDGTFSAATNYTVGAEPRSVAVGDFNGDGWADAATANAGNGSGNTVSVLTNRGDGTFSVAGTFPVGSYPFFAAAADFNGDGLDDIAAVNLGGGSASFLLALPEGGFNPAVTHPAGPGAISAIAADVNGDLRPDLVTANNGSVSVFLGTAGDAPTALPPLQVGHDHRAIGVVDFNGDGQSDLAVSEGYDSSISVLAGRGDGTFRGGVDSYPVAAVIRGIVAGDFDRDGRLDVASVGLDDDEVSVLLQDSNGLFRAATPYPVGDQPHAVRAADFNHDGALDLVTANFDGALTLWRGRTTAPGIFTNNWAPVRLGSNHTDVATGYLNTGTNLDLVAANYYNASLSVGLGNGDGTFRTGATLSVNSGPVCVITNDFNRDGRTDLAVGYDGGTVVSVLNGVGDSAGNFGAKQDCVTWEIPACVASADLNRDGWPDLVAGHYDWRRVSVLTNRGDGTFVLQGMHEVPTDPAAVAIGDFNADNLPDVLALNYSSVSVLLGNGDGTFLTATNYFLGGERAAVGDFDGDGSQDLALSLSDKVGILFNQTVPGLSIEPAAAGVALAWPAWNTYELECSADPAAPEAWQEAPAQTATNGSQFVATNAAPASSQFFRLRAR